MYIIKYNDNIIGIYNNINDTINYLNDYINKSVILLNNYNGDVNRFKLDIKKHIIEYYRNNLLQYCYKINSKYEVIGNNEKFNLIIKDNTNDIFYKEEVNCILPISFENIDLNQINKIRTESLINDDTFDEEISKRKKLVEELNKMENDKKKIEINIKLTKEKEEEYRRKFLVNRKLYFVFKKEMEDKKRELDDIPELFINEWNIFTKMENENTLDKSLIDIDDTFTEIIQKELYIYRKLEMTIS